MSKNNFEDPTIREWRNSIEPAPEGTMEFILSESKENTTKKMQYNSGAKLFRFLSIDPGEAGLNYNSGWLERDKMIEVLQSLEPVISKKEDYELFGFIISQEPYEDEL